MAIPRITTLAVALFVCADSASCGRSADVAPGVSSLSWSDRGGNLSYRIDHHGHSRERSPSGGAAEQVQLTASNGSYVYLGHDIPAAAVIDELSASVWIKADRPGLQILARAVFPRAIDPATNRPITALVSGSSYAEVGGWQRLQIADLPTAVARRGRLLRAETQLPIDFGEVVIDQILINAYGGPGTTRLWIGELEINGAVTADQLAPRSQSAGHALDRQAPAPTIEFEGSVLKVEGRPFFPRAIRYQGESLDVLRRTGFNAIWLSTLPNKMLLAEAAQNGLWIICPPPFGSDAVEHAAAELEPSQIGPEYDRVLAWDLGSGLSSAELDSTKKSAALLRQIDRRVSRPTLCQADTDLKAFSRYVDVLKLDRRPLGTGLELPDYALWLRTRPRFALPDTPIWCTVQTEPTPALEQQVLAVTGASPSLSIESEQIRLLVHSALAAGAQGLCFESRHRLDSPSPLGAQRAAALELTNLELALIEPWAGNGTFVDRVATGSPDIAAAMLQAKRARLVLTAWSGHAAQIVPGQSAAHAVTLIVPGVPQSHRAYEVTPCGVQLLRDRRSTGGTRVTLDEFGLTSIVLMTQDRRALVHMKQRIRATAGRAAQLQHQLATEKLAALMETESHLARLAPPMPRSAEWISMAQQGVGRAGEYFSRGDFQRAYRQAQRAMRPMRLLERARFDQATQALDSPVASPLALNLYTLPLHWARVAPLPASGPELPAQLLAGFESLNRMHASGWRHFRFPLDSVATDAELSPQHIREGNYALHLRSWPAEQENPPSQIETAPIWIESPAVPVRQGEWVRIQGWVNIPEPLTGSVDGLMIFDSIAGRAMARRLARTDGWESFTLYRAAPKDTDVRLTFALGGVGDAWIDRVTITPLGRGEIRGGAQARAIQRDRFRRLPSVR